MSYLVYVILICVSLHACNARQLGVIDKGTYIELPYTGSVSDQNKDIGKAELVHKDTKGEEETLAGFANSMEEESNHADSKGYETKLSSSQDVLHVSTRIEGLKRQLRSTSPQDVEETIKSKEDDTVEDIVAMDYAQPHRKPPIHNKKP